MDPALAKNPAAVVGVRRGADLFFYATIPSPAFALTYCCLA
jgi:hypothetical protein